MKATFLRAVTLRAVSFQTKPRTASAMSSSEQELPPIEVGSRFKDYDTFTRAMTKYMFENNVVFTKQNSRSIAKANQSQSNVPKYNPDLKLSHFTMACKHHGIYKVHKGPHITRFQRPKQRTFKTGCPAVIKVVADRKSNQLCIKQMVSEHNHETGREQVHLYPERRRLLRMETTQLQEQLINCQINPEDLQEYICMLTNTNVTKEDIHRITRPVTQPLEEQQQQPLHVSNQELLELPDNHEEGSVNANAEMSRSEEADVRPADPIDLDRANEAWKCVYMMLENENRKLKETVKRLEAELKKPCPDCVEEETYGSCVGLATNDY